jgi:hypothetical protein
MTFEFSPSIYHQALGSRSEQALRYRGGDVPAWQREPQTKLIQLLGYWFFVEDAWPVMRVEMEGES